MKHLKTFEQFINESGAPNQDNIAKDEKSGAPTSSSKESKVEEGLHMDSYLVNELKDAARNGYGKKAILQFLDEIGEFGLDFQKLVFEVIEEYGQFKYNAGYDSGVENEKENQ